jgi:hypothetical protein
MRATASIFMGAWREGGIDGDAGLAEVIFDPFT